MNQDTTVMSVPKEAFVSAMSHAVNGVAVLTTNGPAGRFGITVSSVASVSADPPLVLASVNRSSPAHAAILANGVFCVNLLSTGQRELADAFAGRASRGRPYDFEEGLWEDAPAGAPRLRGAVATFECVLEQAHEAGSHTVFFGRVTGVTAESGDPLLYTARAYGRPLRWNGRGPASRTAAQPQATAA
jgi:flavin reductase (DIM6/NTAB) family NADH-FMN oxidoreductase RutF